MWKKTALLFSSLTFLFAWPFISQAEQSSHFGDYVVHYNALSTDTLQPTIARRYGIRRSPNRVLLNVSVLRKVMGTTGEPVPAVVNAHVTNMNNQLLNLRMRRINERGAIYYLGDLTVNNGDTLTFTINVAPDVRQPPHTVTFQQQFFTN